MPREPVPEPGLLVVVLGGLGSAMIVVGGLIWHRGAQAAVGVAVMALAALILVRRRWRARRPR